MKTRTLLSIALLVITLIPLAGTSMAAPSVQTPEPPEALPAAYPFDLKEVVSRSRATAAPGGDIIDIAVDNQDDETDPAVALCAHDQYLVVYENDADNEIYGQRLDNEGGLLGGAFRISEDNYAEANPVVACEWAFNRFIVVWQHNYGNGGDWDIRARGVYGGHQTSGSQLYGTELVISNDDPQDELNPAIACNSNEHTCLVVFENSGDIYGQRVTVSHTDITKEAARFSVSDWGAEEINPDVAWGGYDDDYLVVWQYLHDTPYNHYRIIAGYVYDTNQAGDQLENPGAFLIGPGKYDKNQTLPVAAYNSHTRQYLAVCQYDFGGDGTDYDIIALRLTPGGGSWGDVFSIANTSDDETSPAVAFSGGTQSLPGGRGGDQYLVTYSYKDNAEKIIYGQAIKGAHATSGGQHEGDPVRIDSTSRGPNFGLDDSHLTGSVNNGRYMVVWEDMIGGFAGDDYDVKGRMMVPYALYLPLALRNG